MSSDLDNAKLNYAKFMYAKGGLFSKRGIYEHWRREMDHGKQPFEMRRCRDLESAKESLRRKMYALRKAEEEQRHHLQLIREAEQRLRCEDLHS